MGACHTDFYHFGRPNNVPGHEIVGIVEIVGSDVEGFTPGDRIGAGWQYDSCADCSMCLSDHENLCAKKSDFGKALNGGWATHVVWKARFSYKIPDAISNTDAGVLMCAGATMHSALRGCGADEGKTVGIIGIGGLGHLGLAICSRYGMQSDCNVA